MIDYFLRFPDEATATPLLFDEVDGGVLVPRYQAVDVIGIIYKPTGEVVDQGDIEVPVMAAIEGWHVNVRHDEEAPELEPYIVEPKNPVRVWA